MTPAITEKITALALCGEILSPTLGSAERFLILNDGEEELLSYDPSQKKLPLFLRQHKVELLICNGLGNCTAQLLALMGIEVIAGISGGREEVLEKWRKRELNSGTGFSCTERGRSCGECSGCF